MNIQNALSTSKINHSWMHKSGKKKRGSSQGKDTLSSGLSSEDSQKLVITRQAIRETLKLGQTPHEKKTVSRTHEKRKMGSWKASKQEDKDENAAPKKKKSKMDVTMWKMNQSRLWLKKGSFSKNFAQKRGSSDSSTKDYQSYQVFQGLKWKSSNMGKRNHVSQ